MDLLRRFVRFLLGEPARLELTALVLLLMATAGGWAFFELAGEVLEGETRAWDERLLYAMRVDGDPSDPLGPDWLEEAVRDVTALGGLGTLAFLTAFVTGFLFLDRRRSHAVFVLVAVVGGVALSSLLKHTYDRPRPELVSHGARVLSSSFPSGHSMVSATVYLTLGALVARSQARMVLKVYVLAWAFAVALAVGASRLYLGVHWPSDVLAGWSAGAAWAALCWIIARRLQATGHVEGER